MGQGIAKTAMDTMSQPGSAGTVGLATLVAGWISYIELIAPLIGFAVSILGGILTSLLIVRTWSNIKLDRKNKKLDAELKEINIELGKEELMERKKEHANGSG